LAVAPLLFVGSGARADLPDLPLDTLLAKPCGEAKAAAACPECVCEPYTQTYSPDQFDQDEQMMHGLAVHLEGKSTAGAPVKRYVAMFGNPSGFTYAGVLVDYSGGARAVMTASVRGAERFMDMCPGACEHDPVGIVHIFEVTRTSKSISEDPMSWDTTEAELAVCYEQDKRPTCWSVPLSASNVGSTVPDSPGDKPKVKTKSEWKWKWSIARDAYGAPMLKLSKGSGKGDHGMKENPLFAKGGKVYFRDVPAAVNAALLAR
jgi:hypothetical protein